MRIDQAGAEFLRDCANVRKLSEHTTRAYRLDLARFARFAGPASTLRPSTGQRSLSTSRPLYRASSERDVAKRHVASVRLLFRWLEDGGHVSEDPFRGARVRIKLPRRLPRVLSRAEFATILEHPATQDFNSITARMAAELLFATGIRVAELAGLRDEYRSHRRGDYDHR